MRHNPQSMKVLPMVLACLLASSPAMGAQFDGKRPLLCSAYRMFECDIAGGCTAVSAQELGTSSAWVLDFKKKQLTGTAAGSQPNKIDRVEMLDGKLFLTGIQDGLPIERDGVAWSVAINNPDGAMTLTVAGERVAFVGLGNCVAR